MNATVRHSTANRACSSAKTPIRPAKVHRPAHRTCTPIRCSSTFDDNRSPIRLPRPSRTLDRWFRWSPVWACSPERAMLPVSIEFAFVMVLTIAPEEKMNLFVQETVASIRSNARAPVAVYQVHGLVIGWFFWFDFFFLFDFYDQKLNFVCLFLVKRTVPMHPMNRLRFVTRKNVIRKRNSNATTANAFLNFGSVIWTMVSSFGFNSQLSNYDEREN